MAGRVGIVVGNPKAQSRTLALAEQVAAAAADAAGLKGADRLTVDLADLGPRLFDWSSDPVRQAVDGIRSCALVVVASPTYKASYTGLLKSFLDWFGTTDLLGVTVVPVMTGAGAQPCARGGGPSPARARGGRRDAAHPWPLRHRGRAGGGGRGHFDLADAAGPQLRRAVSCEEP